MDERDLYMDGIVDRLVNLTSTERTTALTHLFNLRTAAVEDLSDLDDNRQHWNTVLESSSPDTVKDLVSELTQLTDEELAITADETERAKIQAQLAVSARKACESFIAAQQGLNMQHKSRLAEKMKEVRDAIERGINAHQDVTALEDIFARIEQEFWEQDTGSGRGVNAEEQ
ncbi:hypothetical protein EJ07DRAFT_185142 [Lizonia empirigonia]|nr:hypothetical protein EJ07DRAFT_185142 [Lizonia empirigonia]